MTGRPPKSPLFPYTPLFRSRLGADRRRRCHDQRQAQGETLHGSRSPTGRVIRPSATVLPAVTTSVVSNEDRKSTRLNSSHGYISYAVFCLKKKKNKNQCTPP